MGSAVCVRRDYAYVADGDRGLHIIDVSSPSSPREVGAFDTAGYALGVFVQGRHAYVADHSTGLLVFQLPAAVIP